MAYTVHDDKHLELLEFLHKLGLIPAYGQFVQTKSGIWRVTFQSGKMDMWNIFD